MTAEGWRGVAAVAGGGGAGEAESKRQRARAAAGEVCCVPVDEDGRELTGRVAESF